MLSKWIWIHSSINRSNGSLTFLSYYIWFHITKSLTLSIFHADHRFIFSLFHFQNQIPSAIFGNSRHPKSTNSVTTFDVRDAAFGQYIHETRNTKRNWPTQTGIKYNPKSPPKSIDRFCLIMRKIVFNLK